MRALLLLVITMAVYLVAIIASKTIIPTSTRNSYHRCSSFLKSSSCKKSLTCKRELFSTSSFSTDTSIVIDKNKIIEKPKVIYIAGPTAVGKSRFALELCKTLPQGGEIVSADSVQVYKYLNIGASKPTIEEMRDIPHHLINMADPRDECYATGEYYCDALDAIADIIARGKVPVVCGGTPMYYDWLIHGKPDAPKCTPEVRKKVDDLILPFQLKNDWEGGLNLLHNIDPKIADRISDNSPNNWYRLKRYLEINFDSKLIKNKLGMNTNNSKSQIFTGGRNQPVDYDHRCFFLTADRRKLRHVIDLRCELMVFKGLLSETTNLLLNNILTVEDKYERISQSIKPANHAIGYKQIISYLTKKDWDNQDYPSFSKFMHNFQSKTRQYATTQAKRFRKRNDFMWLDVNDSLPCIFEEEYDNNFIHSNKVVTKELMKYINEFDSNEFNKLVNNERNCFLKRKDERSATEMRFYKPNSFLLYQNSKKNNYKNENNIKTILTEADECRRRLEDAGLVDKKEMEYNNNYV